MKKLLIGALVAGAISSAQAVDVTLEEMQYVPIKERTLVAQPLSFDGELVAFSGKQLHKTKGLAAALEIVDAQSQLSPIRKDAIRAIMYSSAYTMQNATDKVKLQEHSRITASISACGYFAVDEEITYIIESGLTNLVEGQEQFKSNLIAGSLTQVDLAPMHRDMRYLQDAVMHCSENLKMWLPH